MSNKYYVRLAFTMDSEGPSDAVQDVVDTFTENGFRNLVYVVDDADTGQRLGFFNGWGEQLDTADVEERAAGLRSAPEQANTDEPVVLGTLDDAPGDDDELEQLAESLNAGGDEEGSVVDMEQLGDRVQEALTSDS